MIVGTRGRSLGGLQGLLPGSVSKYCLQHSPVPVIVVRPSSKRDKKKAKRKADPGRKVYQEILHNSHSFMNHGNQSRKSISGITEPMSNASRSSLGDGGSIGVGGDVSPRTLALGGEAEGGSPSFLSPPPSSENLNNLVEGGVKLDEDDDEE